MPLSFLNPAMLAGLAVAAVPVIIHFLNRRRLRRVAFSDLRFLREVEAQQARRRGLRRWLLLLLRVLIVACLALAAARPHWGGLPGGNGRSTLFVIDASASMQAQGEDGSSRFDAAIELVGGMVQTLPAAATVQAIQAGPEAVPLFANWLPAGPAAAAALRAALPTDGGLDLAASLYEAARLIDDAPSRPVDLVLVSDLQQGPQPELEKAVAALAATGTRLLVRRLGESVPGGGVLDVRLPGRAVWPGESITVTARVRPERADQAFWLELDGRRVAEAVSGAMPADGVTVDVDFSLTVPAPGLHAGRVGKEPDRLPVDDSRAFALEVPRQLNVTIAHGRNRDELGRGGWRYLARALDPGGRGDGLYRVRPLAIDSLLVADLPSIDVLALVDIGAPGRRLADALGPWLEAGGALLVVAGDPSGESALRGSLLPLLGLPEQAAWVVRPPEQGERSRAVDVGHPVLAGLPGEALESLSAARWWRYFAVDEGESRPVLVADGEAPLLLEGERGRGRWLLLPFHLRGDATDLMFNPMFLPLVQRIVARLADGGRPVATMDVGERPSLPVAAKRLGLELGDSATDLVVLSPPHGQERPVSLRWQAGGPVLVAPPSPRAGIHAFLAARDTLGLVATTVPAAESQPGTETVANLSARFAAAGFERTIDLGESDAAGFARAFAGRDLARWLLGLALVLQALELWLARRVR